MNWPALTPECSQAVAEVLKDVVEKRPKHLFQHVIQEFERRSGVDPKEFESHFEECKRKPRTYILEDRCPDHEDPFSWVPMRYVDKTILLKLQGRAGELITDVLSSEDLPSGQELFDLATIAYPELMYLRGSHLEQLAAQTLRGLFICCSGSPKAVEAALEDEDPALTFRCQSLVAGVKLSLLQPFALSQREATTSTIDKIETLIVCMIMHCLGQHEGFRARYGCGEQDPERVALAAAEQATEIVPSYGRLSEASKRLIAVSLQAHFTFGMLLAAEVTPAHFLCIKELIVPIEGGLNFFLSLIGVEHLVAQRMVPTPPEMQDLVRLVSLCVPGVEKHSASRAYELYLRKRAERHQWRLMRDDFAHRAIIRICCMLGSEDTRIWNEVQHIVESLDESEREVIKQELGQKDGLVCTPAFLLQGGASLMGQVLGNPRLKLKSGVKLLGHLCQALVSEFDEIQVPQVKVHLGELPARVRDADGATQLENIPMMFDRLGPAEVGIR